MNFFLPSINGMYLVREDCQVPSKHQTNKNFLVLPHIVHDRRLELQKHPPEEKFNFYKRYGEYRSSVVLYMGLTHKTETTCRFATLHVKNQDSRSVAKNETKKLRS